jgi:hypothetical protein
MDQWKNIVIVGVADTPQFDADLERAGREGYEAVGLAAFGGQLTVLLKKRVTLGAATVFNEAPESQYRPA